MVPSGVLFACVNLCSDSRHHHQVQTECEDPTRRRWFLLLVHVTEAKNLRFLTQIVLNTTATETDLKTDLLNWIQNLHTIAHFSSIYQISNISIFDNT